jgi:YVTN family beta-propeller protein
MKKLISFLSTFIFLQALPAQQVISNILLPDSMGGMPNGAYCCVYNEANNCIYVGGEDLVIVIDGVSDRKIARIPVEGKVTSMLWVPGENKIFCTHYDDARLTVIDAASNSVITTMLVGVNPIKLAYSPVYNRVYCANKRSRDIDVIDASTNSGITVLSFPDEPFDMVYQETGSNLLLDNVIYCIGGEYFGYFRCNTNQAGGQYSNPGSDFSAVAVNTTDHKVYFADRAYDQVQIQSNTLILCTVGDEPVSLVWNETGDKIYCANYGSDNISVINGVTDNVIATIPAGDGPVGLCWNSIENKVYCLNSFSRDITIIDGLTDAVITTVPAKYIDPYGSYGVKPHLVVNSQNNKLYLPQIVYRDIIIIDGSSNAVSGDILLGASPQSLVWNPTSNKLYSINQCDWGSGSISIIDGASHLPIFTLAMGDAPSAVVLNSTNNTIFCANAYSNDVRVVDGVSDQITDTITVSNYPVDILWNPTSNKIYTANANGNSVSIINGSTHALLTTVPTGSKPLRLSWNGINNKIYAANYGSSTVTVIDGFSNNAIATIPVGPAPISLVWNETSNKVYCGGLSTTNSLSIIDGLMDTVITSHAINNISNLTWNETNNKVYCSGLFENIFIIDGVNNQIADTIRLENQLVLDQYWNSLENRLYCYTFEQVGSLPPYQNFSKLNVIDGSSDTIITTMLIDENPWAVIPAYQHRKCLAENQQSNQIFIADYNKCLISVIDPTVTGIISEPLAEIPEKFVLQQNYPNPFNPSTVISWQLAVSGPVNLSVYNITGQRVAVLVNEKQPAGPHSVKFDASGLASGVYLYRFEAEGFVETKKMILMR